MSEPAICSAEAVNTLAAPAGQHAEGSLLQSYMRMREMSLHLCAPLSVEDHALQPMPDASPAKWHLAHTTWFFETFVLSQYMPEFRPDHPAFRNLFNRTTTQLATALCGMRHVLSAIAR